VPVFSFEALILGVLSDRGAFSILKPNLENIEVTSSALTPSPGLEWEKGFESCWGGSVEVGSDLCSAGGEVMTCMPQCGQNFMLAGIPFPQLWQNIRQEYSFFVKMSTGRF
jgi:hypothetical protein